MHQFLFIVFILSIVALVIFFRWYNSPQQKGERGEKKVIDILHYLPDEYHIFNDVVLKTKSGTTQIDHIVVSPYGVFAIETKNYRGDIYGDDKRKDWTQLIVTNVRYRSKPFKTYTYVTKNTLYNPVKQALGHVYEIKKLLSRWPHLRVIPVVVFTGDANLSHVSSNNHVVYISSLLSTIREYRNIYLSEDDVSQVAALLNASNIRGLVDNATHVQNVKAAQWHTASKISSGICPKCGGALVRRSGKYGSFYGCSNYPKCKFTTH